MAKKPKNPDPIISAQDDVLDAMGEDVSQPTEKKPEPGYKVFSGSRVPVSKAFGKTVERRKDAAIKAYEMVREATNEAYRYYNHNQVKDDVTRRGSSADATFRKGEGSENIVYANVSTLVPAIYSKNPEVAFSTEQDEDKEFVEVLGKAVQAIFNKRAPRGVNLKPRAKKAILHAELANLGVLKLEYVRKDDSREEAQRQMLELTDELAKAKDANEVRDLEGKMMALESMMEWVEPQGFKLNNVMPTNLIIDPFAENEDGSDANWMLEEVYLPTSFLNAKYTEDAGDEERKLIYKPTHRVKLEGPGSREDALGLVLEALDQGVEDAKDYMDEDKKSWLYSFMTKCWYYWDKTTRRVYLFVDNDWTWPVWVWEDDLRTSRFFPYFFVIFSPSTSGVTSPSEVCYYLDQQDELNKINAEIVKMRRLAFTIILYNNNKIKPNDAAKLLNYLKTGKGGNALGVDIPDGMTMKDMIDTIVPPSINFEQLFNKQDLYQAIGRLGSVSDILRGQQFKTNTTNKAIETYTSSAKLRLDNRTDAIEDCIADLSWTIAEILCAHVDPEVIKGLVGEVKAQAWKPMTVEKLNATCNVIVAAGSSEKPTSERKKEQAIKVAQAVGQFAAGAPVSSMKIVLKMLMLAFPELEITEEDWAAIAQELQMQMQRGVSADGAAAEGNGAAPAENDVESKLNNLPPEEKARVMQQVQQGVPPQQALAPYIKEARNAA